jgi:hypothetical protein
LHDIRLTENIMRKSILVACVASALVGGCHRQASEPPPQAGLGQAQSAAAAPAGAGPSNGNPAAGPNGSAGRVEPAWREVTIPAGTRLPVRLDQTVASDRSRIEEPVTATLVDPVVIEGVTAVPAGSAVSGVVIEARRAGRVSGRAAVGVRFDTLVDRGDGRQYAIRTGSIARRAPTTHREDALKIGGPAIGGAILGGILGGRKGAAVGGAIGGGAGTAVVLSTRGREIRLPRGTRLAVTLLAPVTVHVPA